MYTLFTKEEIENKYSKMYEDKVIVDLKDDSDTILIKVGDDPFHKLNVNMVADVMLSKSPSYGLVEYGALMTFPSQIDLDVYKETR